MALPTIEIMKKAEHLAARLNSGPSPVKKNVLLGLVSDFMNEPEPDVQRLRHLLELIEQGNGGHIRRGAGYGEQLRAAVREIRKALDERGLDGKDFKSLFGWTARLLLVRSAPRETRSQLGSNRPGPVQPRPPERRESPPGKFGSVNAKGMSDLEKLRQKIQNKEKGGKD